MPKYTKTEVQKLSWESVLVQKTKPSEPWAFVFDGQMGFQGCGIMAHCNDRRHASQDSTRGKAMHLAATPTASMNFELHVRTLTAIGNEDNITFW